MHPHIEFKHVLGELSVNRNDPCEVLRELISNSYDAGAAHIAYIPIKDREAIAFFDDGSGLDHKTPINDITPWEAFFSIGKSTKRQGDSIGYKCQGSKLCFASARILVATSPNRSQQEWHYKTIDNPKLNLDITFDVTPLTTNNINKVFDDFYPGTSADTAAAVAKLKALAADTKFNNSCTIILIDGLETESYSKYFAIGPSPEDSYVYNYIRFYTRHGDVRHITAAQGFSASQRSQISAGIKGAELVVFADGKSYIVPFGYPYLDKGSDPNVKSPAQIARLRDGRFVSRAAKKFSVAASKFSIILTIDGNRRAHDDYKNLGRKGQAKSGVRLSDQRGLFISVKGIKICKYPELLSAIDGMEVLAEGDAPSHYSIIIDGDFDLVTNRSALSKRAYDTLTDSSFIAEVKRFLDTHRAADATFAELLARLRRESSETLLNEQIQLLEVAREEIKSRERMRIKDDNGNTHLFLCPRAGEEYLVGVLYSQLSAMGGRKPGFDAYWRRVITFSTQGIDSLGLRDEKASSPLSEKNICSIEYKYEFNNFGPFNHALAVVDFIVAWSINVDATKPVRDAYTCFGTISKVPGNAFEWQITDVEDDNGGTYPQTITVINLRELITTSFDASFKTP